MTDMRATERLLEVWRSCNRFAGECIRVDGRYFEPAIIICGIVTGLEIWFLT